MEDASGADLLVPLPDRNWLESPEAERVRADIAAKAATRERCKAARARPTKTADEALAELTPAITAFMRQAAITADARLEASLRKPKSSNGSAPRLPQGQQALASAGVGVGKTHVSLEGVGDYLLKGPADRQAPRLVILIIPDHALGEDVAKRFRRMFPSMLCQVYRGIERPDPDAPGFDDPAIREDDKIPMCRRLADAKAVIEAGGSLGSLCGSRKRGHCPHHPKRPDVSPERICGRQRQRTIRHGLLVLAGPTGLTRAPPEGFKRTAKVKVPTKDRHGAIKQKKRPTPIPVADVLIVDEPKFVSMLCGCAEKPYDISLDRITLPTRRFPGDEDTIDDEARAQVIVSALGRLSAALSGMPVGPLTAETLREIGDLADWPMVRRAALTFKADPADFTKPDTPKEELHETLNQLRSHNGRLFRISRLTYVFESAISAMGGQHGDAQSGRVELVENDESGRSLRLRWIEPIAEAWDGIPTLVLDGTPDVNVARHWFPRLTVIADAQAATPDCVTRRQVHDREFSYLAWAPREEEPPPTNDKSGEARRERTAWNNVARLGRLLTVRCAQYRGRGRDAVDVLAVVPQRTEEALEKWFARHGGKPVGLGLLHYNKLRGQDQFGGVRCAIIISRPQPSAGDLERIAWTLTGVRGTRAPDGALPTTDAVYTMRDGTQSRAKAVQHPDPWAERVRQVLCDHELLQAEARARSVRRTPDKPLTVEILTTSPLPLELDELVPAGAVLADGHEADGWSPSGLCRRSATRAPAHFLQLCSAPRRRPSGTSLTGIRPGRPFLGQSLRHPICHMRISIWHLGCLRFSRPGWPRRTAMPLAC